MREYDVHQTNVAQARKWRTILGIAVLVVGATVSVLQPDRYDLMDFVTAVLVGGGGVAASWSEIKRTGKKILMGPEETE